MVSVEDAVIADEASDVVTVDTKDIQVPEEVARRLKAVTHL